MIKLVILAVLLIAAPSPALAAPIITFLASPLIAVGGVTLVTVGQAAGLLLGIVNARYQAAKAAERARRSQEDQKFELSRPTTLPVYRYVYGDTLMTGTPVFQHTEGNILYACYLLNSRPSEGPFEVRVDNRIVWAEDTGYVLHEQSPKEGSAAFITGDPYDFTSDGAKPSNNGPGTKNITGLLRYWIGLGDQVSPPSRILGEIPSVVQSTDAWQNCTVVWIRAGIGDKGKANDNWPARPPALALRGKWSKVYDPRDASQSAGDPLTWKHSNTSALITLDCARTNPLEAFADEEIDFDSFATAADVDDTQIQLKAGGTEAQFETHGVVAFNGTEIATLIEPLFENAAAEPTRVNGKLAILPGTARTSIMTIDDFIGDTLEYQPHLPGRATANTFLTRFTSKDRNYEPAPLEPYRLPGALAEDNGQEVVANLSFTLCQSARQAMKLQKVFAYNARSQQTLTGTLPHAAIPLIVGEGATLGLPILSGLNGEYIVQNILPTLAPHEEDRVAVELSVTMVRASAEAYAWDHLVDELEYDAEVEAVDQYDGMAEPSGVVAVSGDQVSNANEVRVEFVPSTSFDADTHVVERRTTGTAGLWATVAEVQTPEGITGTQTVTDTNAANGTFYDYRVRAEGLDRTSENVTMIGVRSSAPAIALIPPQSGEVDVNGQTWVISFVAPDDPDIVSLTYHVSATAGGTPIYSFGPFAVTQGARLGTSQYVPDTGTHFVYAVANEGAGNQSDNSHSVEVTV